MQHPYEPSTICDDGTRAWGELDAGRDVLMSLTGANWRARRVGLVITAGCAASAGRSIHATCGVGGQDGDAIGTNFGS